MLRGSGIRKSFVGVEALRGVDIEVVPGRVSILLGPNGGGKTTLIRSLALLDLPTAGRVEIDDVSYDFPLRRGVKVRAPWPKLTVVFQQQFLWPHLTLRENIELPLSKREPSVAEAAVADLVDYFGMEAFVDRYPNQVSLGERQRAALARALALNPRYVLLDEITSALDVEQSANVTRYLLALRDRGIGILVVTHLLGFARRLVEQGRGDTIYFLESGRVLEKGGREFFANPQTDRVREFLAALEFRIEPPFRKAEDR